MQKTISLIFISLALALNSYGQIFEVESGVLTGGAAKVNSSSESGGAYVNLQGGKISLDFELETESSYNIYVYVASPFGFKANTFSIDGSSLTFNAEKTSFEKIKVISSIQLAAGQHSIEIVASWGWINIDYIELEEVDSSTRFNINRKLVTPNPTEEAVKLYQFLYDNYNKRIISGVSEIHEAQWLQSKTGKSPALIGLDYLFIGRGYEDWYDENKPFNDGKTWHEQNGIVNFHWHWRDPSRVTEEFYTESTNFDITAIFDPTSADYKSMISDIDYISSELQRFKDLNIPILWRPLHEASGTWFWWGANGPEALKELWRVMYNRMVNVNGLNNLIWVWTDGTDDDAWFPGDEYVDIVGRDIYKTGDHTSQILEFNEMSSSYDGKKMMALTECGSMPDPENLIKDKAGWSWFMVWNGDFVSDATYNPLELWQKMFDSEYVITLDEMPDLSQYKSYGSNQIVSREQTVYTSSGSASYLVDNKFNTAKWTVENNSWIAINVGSGLSQVILNWNNPDYGWSNILAPSDCPNNSEFPVDYNILSSSNSSNGADGDWSLVDTVRGNIVTARAHSVAFTDASWIKMEIINGAGQIDEIEVFDATYGGNDVWFFPGTSISANTYKGTPPSKNFADLINEHYPDYSPVMIRGGIACIGSADLKNNLSDYLKMAGNAHFWAIEMGTNDAWGGSNDNVSAFISNLQTVIDSCKAYDIEPIIARVLASNENISGWQVHPDYLAAVDNLTADNKLLEGPDLYTYFLEHPEELYGGTDGVHPNATGAASIQRLWAQKMAFLYGDCQLSEIEPYIGIKGNDLNYTDTITVYVGDSIEISPLPTEEEFWTWSGPYEFTANTRTINLNNIQKNQSGSYVVSYTNGFSCLSTATFEVTVIDNPTTSAQAINSNQNNVSIFPNPADHGKFRVKLQHITPGSQLQIYDVQGKLVFETALSNLSNHIDSGLRNGMYILIVLKGREIHTQKLIIN